MIEALRVRSPCTAIFVMDLSMSAFHMSRSSRLRTTPRSTSSGKDGKQALESLRESLNAALKNNWQEWEIPRDADPKWAADATKLHSEWWQARIARQQEIDKSIAAKAEFEYLYDKPYQEKKIIRVAGPFTVESMSPHRVMTVGPDDELIDPLDVVRRNGAEGGSFAETILGDLKIAGVQQAHKADKIAFTALTPWPGDYICADGRYIERDAEFRQGTPRGNLYRARVWNSATCGSRSRSQRGGRRGIRRSHCLRVCLRSSDDRLQQTWLAAGAKGTNEC